MKVICIKQHNDGILTVGKIYEVCGIDICRCGLVSYDVGIKIPPSDDMGIICECSFEIDTTIWWLNSNKFAPPEEKGEMFIEEFLHQKPNVVQGGFFGYPNIEQTSHYDNKSSQ